MALDAAGNAYVGDQGNNRIQVFTSAGAFVRQWGSGDGPLNNPGGVAVDPSGEVYVADQNNSRIQVFTSEGVFLRGWGSLGSGFGLFQYPRGLALDGAGNVVRRGLVQLSDSGLHAHGCVPDAVGYGGHWGPASSDLPFGVAVDGDGNVFVADTYNHRIQKFGPLPTEARNTSWGRVKALYR